ncbi:MAG: hypothetical protein JO172_13715, partial [Hyphomicrobiales bacterium]|nr:hypothetical protein [Hyphomicrobiales bacterium]
MIGAITIIVWVLILSNPRVYKVKDHAVDAPHLDIPSAAQPHSPKFPSRLAEGHDERLLPNERIALGEPTELGSASKPSATSDPGAEMLFEASPELDIAARMSGKAQREISAPEHDEAVKPTTSAALSPTSSATSPDAAREAEI